MRGNQLIPLSNELLLVSDSGKTSGSKNQEVSSKEQGIKPRQKSSEWLNDNNIIDIYFYLANKQFFLAIKIVLKKSKSDLAAAITCLTLIQKASFKIDVNFSEKIKNLKQILIHQQSDYYQT